MKRAVVVAMRPHSAPEKQQTLSLETGGEVVAGSGRTQGERRRDPAVQVSRPEDHPANAGSHHADGDRRVSGVSEGLERLLRLCTSKVTDPGPGKVGTAQIAMLSPEAVGKIRLSPVAQARGECKTGLEHGQVGSWSVAFEPESGISDSFAPTVFSVDGFTGPG